MDAVLTTVITALIAGATAKVKDVASQAVADGYEALKSLLIRKLGKSGAVQNVEDDPESKGARESLIEAMAKKNLQIDSELEQLAQQIEKALADAKAAGVSGAGDIEIESVRGGLNAIVEDLAATGRIRVGPVVAETGNAEVRHIRVGGSEKN